MSLNKKTYAAGKEGKDEAKEGFNEMEKQS